MKMKFLILPALALGLVMTDQSGRANNDETVVSTNCALAIFSALQHLTDEAFLDSLGKNLREFLRENYRDVRCELRSDEVHITLAAASATRGGDIVYRVGVESLEIRESRFER